MKKTLLILLVLTSSFTSAKPNHELLNCEPVNLDGEELSVCFQAQKKCTYFNYHNMAPAIEYDCWSEAKDDPNRALRTLCSKGHEQWPECAGGFIE